MESHIERLIKFLDKVLETQDLPKMLREDVQWASELINENHIYSANLDQQKYNKEREEISAWLDKINLS